MAAKKEAAKKKVEPKTEEEKDQEFLEAFQKLCEKHQRGLTASPSWRFSQDGNDFRLVINLAVNRMTPDEA